MASLDCAIRLATQAVHQDSAKNYEEAARCYREAVVAFRTAAAGGGCGKRVRQAVEEKCRLYEARLRKLDRHLLSKADLSKLFRECVEHELRREGQGSLAGADRRLSRSSRSLGSCHSSEDGGSNTSGTGSVDSEILTENPFLRKGLEVVDRAKREDARCHLAEALHFYEQGAGHLLDAVRKGRVPGEQQQDAVRIKCLLVHDRCELIREHLESGAPLQIRTEPLDSLECSLEGSPECAGSPTPADFEEERGLLDMEEVRSKPGSVAGSTHSLYPTCVEIRARSDSVMSGQSDFTHGNSSNNNNNSVVVTADVIMEEERKVPVVTEMKQTSSAPPPPAPTQLSEKPLQATAETAAAPPPTRIIPLADLDEELQLSQMSIRSRGSSYRGDSTDNLLNQSGDSDEYVSPIKNSTSLHSLYRLGAGSCGSSHSCVSSRSESRLDNLLVLDAEGKLSVSCCNGGGGGAGEADRNVTELTFANSEIDASSPFKDVLVLDQDQQQQQQEHQAAVAAAAAVDSGSDSGFSDPSPEATAREKTPEEEEEQTRKSPLSDIDSIDIVPSLPQPSPDQQQQQQQKPTQSSPSSSLSSPTSSTRRRRSNRSGSSVKIDPTEDRVMILESETVVNPKAAGASPEARRPARPASPQPRYYYAPSVGARDGHRAPYVPPRSMAPIEEDEDINKGCYYFMACLDTFWIL